MIPRPISDLRVPSASGTTRLFIQTIIVAYMFASSFHAVYTADLDNQDDVIDLSTIMYHSEKLVRISESYYSFDQSRKMARSYISEILKMNGFSDKQITYHKFRWTDTVKATLGKERKIIKSTWNGSNILVWLNTSTALPGRKLQIISASYDSQYWARTNQPVCETEDPNPVQACRRNSPPKRTSPRSTISLEFMELSGASYLIELCILLLKKQKTRLNYVQNIYPNIYSSKAEKSEWKYEDGVYSENPILFVFFDQESVDQLGSHIFVEYYNISSLIQNGDVASLNYISLSNETPAPYDPTCKLPNCEWNYIQITAQSTADIIKSLLTEYDENGQRVSLPADQSWVTLS